MRGTSLSLFSRQRVGALSGALRVGALSGAAVGQRGALGEPTCLGTWPGTSPILVGGLECADELCHRQGRQHRVSAVGVEAGAAVPVGRRHVHAVYPSGSEIPKSGHGAHGSLGGPNGIEFGIIMWFCVLIPSLNILIIITY